MTLDAVCPDVKLGIWGHDQNICLNETTVKCSLILINLSEVTYNSGENVECHRRFTAFSQTANPDRDKVREGCYDRDPLDSPEVDVDFVWAELRGPGLGQQQRLDSPVEPEQGGPPGGVWDHLRGEGDTAGHAAHWEAGVIKPEHESFKPSAINKDNRCAGVHIVSNLTDTS